MRLNELFEDKPFIVEAPDASNTSVPPRTVTLSLADIYKMTNRTPPSKMGPNGQLIYPKGFHDKKTYEVGAEGVDPKIANAIKEYQDAGGIKGIIMRDNELRPYDENNILVDLGWAFAAGTAELAASWMKGGAYVIDDAINNLTYVGRLAKSKGEKLSDVSKATLTGYNDPEMDDQGEYKNQDDKFFMDRFQEYLTNKTDESFRDNVDLTTSAVTDFNSAVGLFMGATGFNLEGAAGVIIGELPSEIVDIVTITTTGPIAGMAISTKLNALEAGGAVAQSITDRVNRAFNDGKLQQTGHFEIYKDAALQQLQEDGEERTAKELQAEASDMARKFAIDASIRNAFYKVAVTGGVLDTIQNKVLYGKVIKPKFMQNAIMKAKIGTLTEGASEAAEQWFENGGIIDGAGNITTRTEGVVNAAYNGMLAAQSGNITAATVGGAQRIRAGAARLRQFVMGGSKDPQALVDLMTINPNELAGLVTKVDENGVRRFAISDLVKARSIGSADIEEAKKNGARVNRRGQYTITKDGKTVKITLKQARQNDADIELISILDDNEIDPDEGIVVVNVGDKNEVRRVAALLGLDSKGSINSVLKRIEDVRKIDVRVKGRSTLEAPIFSDLDEQQQLQYWKEGKVTFTGDKERGNQTWTRNQIMFNSRRNNDTIPEDLANLGDNTFARPDLNSEEYAELKRGKDIAQQQIDIAEKAAERNLTQQQRVWDSRNPDADPNNPDNPRPTRENLEARGEYYVGAQALQISTAKQQIKRVNDAFNKDQRAWDAEYGESHLEDGSIKKGREYFDEKFKADMAAREVEKEKVEQVKKDNAEVEGIEVMTEPPTSPELNPANEETFNLSKQHIIASTKLEIATRDMDPKSVKAMLTSLEKAYPGISNDIISPEDLAKYEQLPAEVREKLNGEVQQTPPESLPQPQMDRPPQGTVVEIDNKPYVWLGAPNGKGGMWAEVKEDGTRGTTNHTNHKALMKKWKDATIDTTKPVKPTAPEMDEFDADDEALRTATKEKQKQANTNNVTNIANNGEPVDQEGGVAQGVSDIDDTDTEDTPPAEPKFFDPSKAKPDDQQYKDVTVPQSVQDQYNEVLATKNAIKIDRFLKGLPANQAGSLRMNPPITPSSRPDALDLPSTSAPDPVTGSGRGDGQAELDARKQKAKDDKEKADKEKADADADADNIELDTTATKPTTGSGRGDGQAELDARQKRVLDKAKADAEAKAKADAEADADNIELDTTAPKPTTGSGRGDGQAELDARQKRVLDRAKADAEAQAKADADAEADADNIDLDTGSPDAPDVTTTVTQPKTPQGSDELDIDAEPTQDPKVTTKKPDELQQPDKTDKSPKPDELAPEKPKVTITAPVQPTQSDDDDSMDSPELDIGVDEPVTTKQPPNLVAPNTDPEAGGPVNFIPTDQLSPQQKKELDDIARRNQSDQEKAAGTDAETRAQQAKDKLKQNQDKLDKVTQQADTQDDSEIPTGITSPSQTSDMTGQQNNPNDTSTDTSTDTDTTQQVDPNVDPNIAMGLTAPVATKTLNVKKGKTRQQKTNKDQTPRTKGLMGGPDDDDTDFTGMLKFNPAKYKDPLQLDKYKGGMQRQQGFGGKAKG